MPFELVLLGELPAAPRPPEGTQSYADNALAKARDAARRAASVAVADDSGLEVDALAGAPGVLSARFGGEHLTDDERCDLVLAQLRGVEPARRTARYRCVIALADPTGREEVVEGTVEGLIADTPRGHGGFGYDPIFVYPPLGRTFGELSAAAKAAVSHRAVALRLAAERLGGW